MDHDSFFKTLLKEYLADFLRLFYPAKAFRLDLRSVRFRDKEVFTDLPRGEKRLPDLLAEVRTRGGDKELVLVHVEVEARKRSRFEARMFRYYMALRLRHDRPVLPIALVLRGAQRGMDRPVCREGVLGDEVCVFRFWRIGLSKLAGARYVRRENSLAPALAALMRPRGLSRADWRLECVKRIARIRASEARKSLLLDCVESYLPLSPKERGRYNRLLRRKENREVGVMRKLWSEQLIDRGRKLGERRGERRAKRETLLRQLRVKFGSLPKGIAQRVKDLDDVERLDVLLKRILTAASIEEMGL